MGPLDAIFHLVNFLAPALGMALVLPTLVRVVWFRALKSVSWAQMARRIAAVGVGVLVAGVVVLGRDGAMLTYAALVLASAGTVWWTAFRGRR
jgi:hypothetical protein